MKGRIRSERLGGTVDLGSRMKPVRCRHCGGVGCFIEWGVLYPCPQCDGTGLAHLGALVLTEYHVNRLKHFALWGE